MRVLNLYAGIGGNRKLWTDCKVTTVELDESIAKYYKDHYPEDELIIGDAHQFLLDHYKEFDFIWSSSPCPSHSRARYWGSKGNKIKPIYPDMRLYEEIIFLDNYFDGKWVSENVVPYYPPLIPGKKIGKHMFWSNFIIPEFDFTEADINRGSVGEWEKLFGINTKGYKFNIRKDKILRNCVHPETGLYIFNHARGIVIDNNKEQLKLL